MPLHLIESRENEEARLNALRDLRLLDTSPSESFDRLTRLASRLLCAPVSTISLTDRDRQWFKSKVGVDLTEIPREQAPCNYAIQDTAVFVVPDLQEDARFKDSPLAQAGIRFYAGAPLITRTGYGLGTLCVVDVKPRRLDEDHQQVLKDLAAMVMSQIELQNMIGRVDSTSGLPNLHQLLEDLEDARRHSDGGTATGIVIDFLPPNHASHGWRVLGADYADKVVCDALRTIQPLMNNEGKLYHISTTRCGVLLMEGQAVDPADFIDVILARLQEPVLCNGVPVVLAPVLGSYQFTLGEDMPRTILRRMFSAVEDAQQAYGSVASYDPATDLRAARSFVILNDFKYALKADNQLSLHYQPRVTFAGGRCERAEALLRWDHPSLGSVSPEEFIPAVEHTALIGPLTDWVIHSVLRQAVFWNRKRESLTVSMNVSAANLDEHNFATRLIAAVEQAGLAPGLLELEFTESAFSRDSKRMLNQLMALKEFGVEISIDDFGTGYSNVSYLQQFPASAVKIDRSFIIGLEHSARDQTLVRTMIDMGHDLGYRVIAEGIESKEAWEILSDWKCDEGQGFYLGRPMPAAAMSAFLAATGEIARQA